MTSRGLLVVALLAGGVPGRAAVAATDCEPARCAVQAAIAQNCSCATAPNHGQYVSCVAHQVKALVASGAVPTTCKGAVTRCAAKSVCGKAGFVTCEIPTDACVIPAGATTGTCAANPALTCATSLDCGAACKIKHDADLCTAVGGTVGTSPTCCASCTPTP
ncbi:MAG TPA: hypothetical protein VKW76_11210 [Candidatus Binatia bacterium]|nr:hypothetical protein [Candidatus Binatia bacterium]